MKLRLIGILSVLALFACDSKEPSASADQPTEESFEASDDKKQESSADDGDDDRAAAEDMSDEQKVRSFCGRPYSKLAEKVAEGDTESV